MLKKTLNILFNFFLWLLLFFLQLLLQSILQMILNRVIAQFFVFSALNYVLNTHKYIDIIVKTILEIDI